MNIPGTVTEIGENIFCGTSDNLAVYGYGSAAQIAAAENKPFYESVRIKINGAEQKFDAYPIVKDGCTMIPMRKVFEGMGAEVNRDL